MAVLKTLLQNKYAQAVLNGLKACIIGIVLATGFFMITNNCISSTTEFRFDIQATIITIALAAIMWGTRPILKKKISPIMLIVVSAGLGIIAYTI